MIYGDQVQNDTTTLEKAVRWVIILIVFVFDPLALSLVIAAQHSYRWLDDDLRNRKKEDEDKEPESKDDELLLVDEFLEENFDDILKSTEYVEAPEEKKDVEDDIQQDIVEPDTVVGNDELETPISPSSEDDGSSGSLEEKVEGQPGGEARQTKTKVIRVDGVTIQEGDGGYVKFEGKGISKDALRTMRPDLFLQVDTGNVPSTNFGTEFPKFAKKGDTFVRVDTLPNKVFKFSGDKWIEINKKQTNTYLYDEEYVKYLVEKIDAGEYVVS